MFRFFTFHEMTRVKNLFYVAFVKLLFRVTVQLEAVSLRFLVIIVSWLQVAMPLGSTRHFW